MSASRTGPAKIMVVDADPTICLLVQDFLADEGYQVVVGAPGALCGETLAAIEPDLLLIDLTWASSEATLELLDRLRDEVAAALPPIVLTTTDPHVAQCLTLTSRVPHYTAVLKPFSLEVLTAAVRHALGAPPRAEAE